MLVIVAFIIAIPSYSQNTKGDKPSNNQRSILRIPRIKSKKKGGDKAYRGDISGRRRIRTKNKSSAVRAIQTAPLPDVRRRTQEVNRVGKPIGGGTHVRIRSSTAKAARNNVYPNHGEFVHNPSKKPHDTQRAYPSGGVFDNVVSWVTKREPPGSKKRITPRSASGSFITRGRKNVYWGKFRKGERPITTDLTGRALRAKNFHSPGLGVIPAPTVYRRKKRPADRPYKGTFISGYATSAQRSRAWTGDLSGRSIRKSASKNTQIAGQFFEPRRLSNSSSARTSKRIPVRYPGQGISIFKRFLGKFSGRKNVNGGGSASRGFNNNGQPIQVRPPGIGANMGNFSGSIRSGRQPKGGGSISGRSFNNAGKAIDVKAPGTGAKFVGQYQGFLPMMRRLKGGGSISGRSFNNAGRAINVRAPGTGAKFVGQYQGFLPMRKQPKGGGSISGRSFNNAGKAIDVRAPSRGAKFVGQYQGFLPMTKQPKGGGSISGRVFNNNGHPIDVKTPGIGAKFIGQYQGFIKSTKPLKGGGSISGSWNNGGKPIERRSVSPAAFKIGMYAGNLKAKRPEKGGGSISGKVWNNSQKPILVHTPLSADAYDAGYSGRIRLSFFEKKYVRNPHANKDALKKIKPDKNVYAASGLHISVKQKDYGHNKLSAKDALKGERPGKNSVMASEYDGRMKMMWAFKNNPSSHEGALKSRRPTNTFMEGNGFAGRLSMKKYIHNPRSNKNALDVMAPSRAMARIRDYQGNLKMSKPNGKNLHPDAQFAHSYNGNIKRERTLLMNIKLKWAKLFKRSANQPEAVKEKVRRPRYDKKEKELWKDLYD